MRSRFLRHVAPELTATVITVSLQAFVLGILEKHLAGHTVAAPVALEGELASRVEALEDSV